MSVITRDLQPFAIARQTNQEVIFVYDNATSTAPNLDGTFTLDPQSVPYMARVVDLTPDQIQRLQEGGITIHSGAIVSVPFEVEQTPSSIIYDGSTYKVTEGPIAEGCSTFYIDKAPIGFSNVEPQA